MSMITRCPHCSTHFRVLPEQLKISEGWARCGQCKGVFDAAAHSMVDVVQLTEIVPAPPEVFSRPLHPNPGAQAPTVTDLGPSQAHNQTTSPAPKENLSSRPPHLAIPVPPHLPSAPDLPSRAVAATATRSAAYESKSELKNPSFIQEAKSKARWNSPRMRFLMFLACTGLVGLLVLQSLVYHRNYWSAKSPHTLKPLSQSVCSVLGCKVTPWQSIEAVKIAASGFTKLPTGQYRLALALENTAMQPVALPHAQLLLLNSESDVLVRRVFTPTQLQAKLGTIGPEGEETLMAIIDIADSTLANQVTSFKTEIFYP